MAYVSNKPLREAFLRSGRSSASVARELGHLCKQSRPLVDGTHVLRGDGSMVKRRLGLLRNSGEVSAQRYMRESTALRYARVLGLDPHEIGL